MHELIVQQNFLKKVCRAFLAQLQEVKSDS